MRSTPPCWNANQKELILILRHPPTVRRALFVICEAKEMQPAWRVHTSRVALTTVLSAFTLNAIAADPTLPATGPLRAHPTNPRYFTDGTKLADGSLKAVYLCGSHTWNNLADMGPGDPPQALDFDGYLDFLVQHNHNFIRLWAWDSTTLDTRG